MKTINREQLKEMIDRREDIALINVLPLKSFMEEHIPGSECVPVEDPDFERKVQDLVAHHPNRKVVVYCASFSCEASTRAARKLQAAGLENIYEYEGGMADWKQANLPVARGAMVTAPRGDFDPSI